MVGAGHPPAFEPMPPLAELDVLWESLPFPGLSLWAKGRRRLSGLEQTETGQVNAYGGKPRPYTGYENRVPQHAIP